MTEIDIAVELVPTYPITFEFLKQGPAGENGEGGGGAVDSVNGQTGEVVLDAGDVGADPSGTAASAVSAHESDTTNIHGISNTANLETTSGAQAKADAKVAQTITNGVTTSAPSQDVVFDALAGKSNTGHTHTASEVTDFSTAADSRVSSGISTHVGQSDPHTQYQKESEKGSANGYAELDGTGKVPSAQLPSYVDDVVEAANFAALPGTGETGKIYITLDDNKTFRWSGSAYIEISASLALGETSSTAYRGDRGKTAYDHSQLTSGNPHNVTKSDVGLGNADNTSDADKPISTATQTALNQKTDVATAIAFAVALG